jgi:IS4 transposase
MFLDLLDMNKKFLFRLSSVHFKREQKSMMSDDCVVEIIFDKDPINAAAKENPGAACKMSAARSLKLRFVRIKLSSSDEKVVAANLSDNDFSTEEIACLYTLRWGIETVYDDLKNKLEIENFTGTKANIILQDVFAAVFLSNIINDIIIEASANLKQNFKYEMQINRVFSIGVLKVGLFAIFLEKSQRKRCMMLKELEDEILTQLFPLRPGRSYYRPTGLASKYSNVRKRTY